jgi:hypothetical protein
VEANNAPRASSERPQSQDYEVVQMTTVKCGATQNSTIGNFAYFAKSLLN